ncbi:hypothetical protein M9Y10_045838 [Tritrichomonas musculus]|uniref:Uncharacterized protein n=1 Tax=Tritrichomonas musculus TaxID=1915356 RepID=A0ABR2JY47_9EUKA
MGNKKDKKSDKKIDEVSQNLERKHFYIMFTIASILFSVLLAGINSSHLILFYVFEKQPFFPPGWNPWYNVIYVIGFYMLLYSYVYVKSYQIAKNNRNDGITENDTSSTIFIYVALSIFACSFVLHVYTEWFILDYQPPNYISD